MSGTMTRAGRTVAAVVALLTIVTLATGCVTITPSTGGGTSGKKPPATKPSQPATTAPSGGQAKLVTVPNVIGRYYDDASDVVRAAGLEAVDVSIHGPVDPDAGEIGQVYRETPAAGTQVPEGTQVELRTWWESQ